MGSSSGQECGVSSRRNSATSIEGLPSTDLGQSTSVSSEELRKTDYDQNFPAFFIQSHTNLAPHNRFMLDKEQLVLSRMLINDELRRREQVQLPSDMGKKARQEFDEFLRQHSHTRRKQINSSVSVKSVIASIHGTAFNPIDLTGFNSTNSNQNPRDLLKSIRVKYLRFAEDVRPPYIGTYTKNPQGCSASNLCKKPFTRALPATNYDYDSEAEWEEPEEGEDLDSEGEEESGDEEGGDDLKGFLDDDDGGDGMRTSKRRHIMGDVQPTSTGLCWEDLAGGLRDLIVPYGQSSLDLKPFRLDSLLRMKSRSVTLIVNANIFTSSASVIH